MFIFILIVLAATGGCGFYWYTKKRNECQNAYNTKLNSIYENFKNKINYSDYFNESSQCIITSFGIRNTLIGTFPKFVLSKIDPNNDIIMSMCNELSKKLCVDCDSALTNSSTFDQALERICQLQVLIKQTNGYVDNSFVNKQYQIVQGYFSNIQNKLDKDFIDIAKDFLHKTTYESVINYISDIIIKSEKLINSFSNYQIKPKDNSQQVSNMKNVAEKFGELYKKIVSSDDCYMIEDKEYGRCDNKFYNYASSMDTQTVNTVLQTYDSAFENGDFNKILSVDLKLLAAHVWHFALLKPFSTEAFEKASKLYNGFYKNIYTAEILLAELYYIKQMGGDTVIRNKINDLLDEKNGKIREMIKYNVVLDKAGDNRFELANVIREHTNCSLEDAERIINGHTSIIKEAVEYNLASSIMYDINRTGSLASITYHHNTSSKLLTTIASGLMWIGAYDSEKVVLEYMLSKKLPMTQKQQERLHSLNNGGGEAPKGHTVASSEDKLYFDISSISWHDDEYKGFFENLAFEEKILQYSVAVRDEDKELMISKRVKLPEQTIVLDKIKSVFEEEYGDTVTAKICRCCALSGTNQENLEGILVQSNECKQLGVLVHMACIGKKFTIKFFSLFMPEVKDLNEQKQQLLSLYKKMSPSVTMWENSLKDTILIAFQQLLNELPSSNTVVTNGNDVEF